MEKMSERWKPEVNERFWYITNALNVCCTTNNDVAIDRCKIRAGNCFRTEAEAAAASQKVRELMRSLHSEPVTNCNQLPKLTAEVFDRPDCPEWAKYAAVDKYEKAMWYEDEPKALGGVFWNSKRGQIKEIPGEWDASDWKNSLIERPAKMPDWCKVGEWVYHDSDGYYYKIKSIDKVNDEIQITDGKSEYPYTVNEIGTLFSPARLRPYNADEMRGLVGKVIEQRENASVVVFYSSKNGGVIFVNSLVYTATDILNNGYTIDGSPCGVFEHLENGEWVE